MWEPDHFSSDEKPELIGEIQSQGFDIHGDNDIEENGNDLTTISVGFPRQIKKMSKEYSRYNEMPSQTVIEMVLVKEAKRLGTDFLSRCDLPNPSVWSSVESCVEYDSFEYNIIKDRRDIAEISMSIGVPDYTPDEMVRMKTLKETTQKLNERIEEFPLKKKGIYTIGLSRLIKLNPDCFFNSLVDISERILSDINGYIQFASNDYWSVCRTLGRVARQAKINGNLYEGDFDILMETVRDDSETTYEVVMEAFDNFEESDIREFGVIG